jgi:large subunit ribosomal protein L3
MAGLLGKKIGMTSVFDSDGNSVSVTIIEAGPCTVLQKRAPEKEGYSALRVGFGVVGHKHTKPEKRELRVGRPALGMFKKLGQPVTKVVREVRVSPDELSKTNIGDQLKVELFKTGQKVDVTGVSKGRGFAGVFKRHHMSGHSERASTHEYFRHPGAIGQRKTPGKVWKQKRMPGHMGVQNVTVQNLKVVEIVADKNLLLVEGSVPGANGGLLMIRPSVKAKA